MILSSFSSWRNHWLIRFFAWVLLTTFSQSRLGPLEFCEVIISTRSPLWSSVSMGTSFPLTLAPTILFPTAEWMVYAKSMVQDPAGRVFTSPAGEKQYTLSVNRSRSLLRRLINSRLSDISCCHSRICRSQFSFSSSCSGPDFLPSDASLYFQWAAMPYSAVRCISKVRIWISKGWPLGPISVVCSDWYIFCFGMAI